MPPFDTPRLVEEALRDVEPVDADGGIARHLRETLSSIKMQARLRGGGTVNRATLALVITGDAEGCAIAAKAYAKSLYGYDLTDGNDNGSGTVVKTAQWRDIISDPAGNPLPFGKALDRLYAEKMEAECGVLVINGIYDLPANAANATAVDAAKNGAFQMLHDLMTEYAEKHYTPVIVLTGDAEKMDAFLKKTPGVAGYFTQAALSAIAPPPPPPPPVSIETDNAVTIRHPLKLKRPGL
jgi:hypothetical protein